MKKNSWFLSLFWHARDVTFCLFCIYVGIYKKREQALTLSTTFTDEGRMKTGRGRARTHERSASLE